MTCRSFAHEGQLAVEVEDLDAIRRAGQHAGKERLPLDCLPLAFDKLLVEPPCPPQGLAQLSGQHDDAKHDDEEQGCRHPLLLRHPVGCLIVPRDAMPVAADRKAANSPGPLPATRAMAIVAGMNSSHGVRRQHLWPRKGVAANGGIGPS
jgi:hypothetical protein